MGKNKVSDYSEQIRGVSYKPEDLHEDLNDNSIVLLRANNISDGEINFEDVVYVDKSKVSDKQLLRKGDILVCASSGSKHLVGKAAQVDFNGNYTFGAFCKVVRPGNINYSYLGMYFQSREYRRIISSISQGANINNIKNENIDNLMINVPGESEQINVAEILTKVSKIIKLKREQLDSLDELIKSRFVEMFGDPKINPYGYDKKMLKETCKVVTGNTPSRAVAEYYGDYIEWIKTDNIVSGVLNPTTAAEYLSEKGVNAGRTVDVNSILMACIAGSIASIGRVCITNRKVAFNQQINAVVPESYNIYFVYVMLQISKEYLVEEINMALKGILSKSKLEDKIFFVPPIELQNQFASFVQQVGKLKVEVQKSLDKTQVLFDSLMQQYFE